MKTTKNKVKNAGIPGRVAPVRVHAPLVFPIAAAVVKLSQRFSLHVVVHLTGHLWRQTRVVSHIRTQSRSPRSRLRWRETQDAWPNYR